MIEQLCLNGFTLYKYICNNNNKCIKYVFLQGYFLVPLLYPLMLSKSDEPNVNVRLSDLSW